MSIEIDLENSVALLTGGGSGFGLATAKELLRNGLKNLAILDLATSEAEESTKQLNAEFGGNGRVIFIVCDVTDAKAFEAAFEKTIEEFGGLDIVINNAGILNGRQWELMININYTAVVRGTLLGLQHMGKDRGGKGGVIVNIASIFGLDPVAFFPVYDGTKHAVTGFTRSMGLPYHYNKTGVRVLTMCPGIAETPLVAAVERSLLEFIDVQDTIAAVKDYSIQKPENVARGIVRIIQSAKSGTVWIAEGDQPVQEIFIPDRFTMQTSQKKE